MAKFKYEAEYEFNTSIRIIFPYLMPKGLTKWLAQKVVDNSESKTYTIFWDNEPHYTRLTRKRVNKSLRYVFSENGQETDDSNYLDLVLIPNEMTETVFLQVTDYSDMDDEDELQDMWENLIENLQFSLKNRSVTN